MINLRLVSKVILVYIFSFLFIVGLVFATSLLPIKKIYKIIAITSGSMGHSLPKGSLAIVLPKNEYQNGRIITFYTTNKTLLTHRLLSKNGDLYQTKGDNNKEPDGFNTTKDKIIGEVYLYLPAIGLPILYAKTVPGLILLVIIPGTIIVYEEVRTLFKI